ncbi:hypothetical protein HK096_007080 [Nowakowskiella sp. JEL0078]|nr:hypothetical protein HK096_007080 [Nowakowskiella sp. JEL0078]
MIEIFLRHMIIPLSELSKHNSAKDCWIALFGEVYNVTPFLNLHPGGTQLILRDAGKDASASFSSIHSKSLINYHIKHLKIGDLSPEDAKIAANDSQKKTLVSQKMLPNINMILNVEDFEKVAKEHLNPEPWAYVAAGAMDEITLHENKNAFKNIWLRPRVMVDVLKVDTSTTILGFPTSLPVFVSGAAMGKLLHPEGEVVLAKGAGNQNIIQMIATLSSSSWEEITSARLPGQTQFFQLYVHPDRNLTLSNIRKVEELGCKALFITVDVPMLGLRERHTRAKMEHNTNLHLDNHTEANAKKTASSFMTHDATLNWSDIPWFQKHTNLPIVLKGIQRGEDAVMAAQMGCQAILVSNHGGRQLDTARPSIDVLQEVMDALRKEGLDNKIEVYLDGGVRRGTDIIKALAIGAKAVGLGRPFLHSMVYGVEGVEKLIDILKDEMELAMRLCGVQNIEQIGQWLLKDKSRL